MKLPEIQRGRVSIPTSNVGVTGAVNKASAIQQVGETLGRGMIAIHEVNKNFETQRAKVNVGTDLANSRAARQDWYTPDQVEAMGLADQVTMSDGQDADGNPILREVIPGFEVDPLLDQRVLERSMQEQGSTIRDDRGRDNWTRDMELYAAEQLEGSIKSSRKQAVTYALTQREVHRTAAIKAGDYDGARALNSAMYTDPAARAKGLHEIDIAEANGKVDGLLVRSSPTQKRQYANLLEVRGEEGTPYDSTQLRQQILTLRSAADSQETLGEADKKDREDALAADTLAELTEGKIGLTEVNNRRDALGSTNHSRLVNMVLKDTTYEGANDQSTKQGFELAIANIEVGNLPDVESTGINITHSEAVKRVQAELVESYANGEINSAYLKSAVARLRAAEDFPYQTPAYTQAKSDLSLSILGYSAGGIQIGAVAKEDRMKYAAALKALNTFVEENGGASADVAGWMRDNKDGFLDETLVRKNLGIPEYLNDVVTLNDQGKVDTAASEQAYIDKRKSLQAKLNELNSADPDFAATQDRIRRLKTEWDSFYRKQEGQP